MVDIKPVSEAVDVFKTLKRLTWRDIELPYESFSMGAGKRLSTFGVSYHSGELIRNIGRNSKRFNYTVLLFQNMFAAWKGNGFTDLLPKLLVANDEDTVGTLIDPILGEMQAYLVEYTYSGESTGPRGGIKMELSFVESTEITEEEVPQPVFTFDAARLAAESFDRVIEGVEGDFVPPDNEPMIDIFDAPHLFASQVFKAQNKLTSTMHKLEAKVERTRRAIETTRNVRNAPAIAAAKELMRTAARTAKEAAFLDTKRKRIRSHITSSETTLLQLSAQLNTSTNKLLELNPSLAYSPGVSANTVVLYEE